MVRVITYGTFDCLHYGHIRFLKHAKALGEYLIVGVTSDDFDKARGKINIQQSLMERVEAIRATGLADEIIVEEYEGQKIDDIRKYDVDIFTVGSDWIGKFDYLNEFCKVTYLERTDGISSSDIRTKQRRLRLGIVGESFVVKKYIRECQYVNGIEVAGVCSLTPERFKDTAFVTTEYEKLLERVDAVYIISLPREHYYHIKKALQGKKHVLCEAPIALSAKESIELFNMAKEYGCVLMDAVKTAYATAYGRIILLAKEGIVGDVYSVDATCTSLRAMSVNTWDSICAWGPTALLPVLNILGVEYQHKCITSHLDENGYDLFTKIDFTYKHAVASVKVGKGVKSEGQLIISGTKGYIYVPAPWWITDYFEVRYENVMNNKRYFYQLDGEGIRYELVAFAKAIEGKVNLSCIDASISNAICGIIRDFYDKKDFTLI